MLPLLQPHDFLGARVGEKGRRRKKNPRGTPPILCPIRSHLLLYRPEREGFFAPVIQFQISGYHKGRIRSKINRTLTTSLMVL